jgi:hypothetical protein
MVALHIRRGEVNEVAGEKSQIPAKAISQPKHPIKEAARKPQPRSPLPSSAQEPRFNHEP